MNRSECGQHWAKGWAKALATTVFCALSTLGSGMGPAHAQLPANSIGIACANLSQTIASGAFGLVQCDSTGALAIGGTFSATLSGFRPTVYGTPVSASNVSSTQTLPAGTQVVATNTSTTVGAYCALGATATTSSQFIPPSSWFGFAISGDTQISCITASSTATINTAGGSGLPTGAGGGGSGGGGGAATIADGADVAEGATSDAAATQGSTGSVSAKLRTVTAQLNTLATNTTSIATAANQTTANTSLSTIGTNTGTTATGIGAPADAAYTGSGSASSIAALKGIYSIINTNSSAALPAGTNLIGKVGIDQTTPGTTNAVSISQINAATALAGNGTTGTGSPRVTVASDNSAVAGFGAGATGAAVPANAVLSGVNVGGNTTALVGDPCQTVARTYTPVNIVTATTTRIISPTSAKKTYICSMFLYPAGTTNIGIVEGTGGTCGTGTAGVIGGTTAAAGIVAVAQAGFVLPNTGYAQAATAGTNVDFCLITSQAIQVSGVVAWVQL